MSINPLELYYHRLKEGLLARFKDYNKINKLAEITRFLDERSITTVTAQELYDKLMATPDAISKHYEEILQEIMEDHLSDAATEAKQDDILAKQSLIITYGLSTTTLLQQVDNGEYKDELTTVYAKACEVLILGYGLITCKVTHVAQVALKSSFVALYLNGVEQETSENGTTTPYIKTFTELQVEPGDLVQLYVKAEDVTPITNTGQWKDFQLYADEVAASLAVQQSEE